MKSLLIFAALFAASIASAQTKAVLKNINGGTITESLTIGSGKTLTIASGATINATGATITGFTASAAWGGITGTLSGQTDLQSALDLKATLASPTFSGNVTMPTNMRLLDTAGDNYARLYIADNLAANYDLSISLASATTLAFNGAVAFGGAFTTDGAVGFTGTSSATFALPSSTARTYTLPTASSTLLAINGDGSSLTGITPSQLAQASATSGQVLTWSGAAWAPATATGGVTSITGTANQITVTGTTTPTLSLPATVSGLTSISSSGYIATGLSLTGSQATNTIDLSTTWNTSGNPALFYARVTNTASGSTAKFFDFGTVAGGSLLFASKSGVLSAINGVRIGEDFQIFSNWTSGEPSYSYRACMFGASIGGILPSDRTFAWSSIGWGSAGDCYSNRDLIIGRDAANTFAQRNSTNPQASRLYETDSGSNDEYLEFSAASGTNTIKPVATGTGTASTVRYYTTTTVWFGSRSGTPEANETAGIGSLCTDTATGTVYRKTSGSGNTGWVTP